VQVLTPAMTTRMSELKVVLEQERAKYAVPEQQARAMMADGRRLFDFGVNFVVKKVGRRKDLR